jgi:Tol biopolymer transport system component
MTQRRKYVICTALSTVIATVMMLVVGASPAPAAFPGANGKIAFTSSRDGNHEVYVMNADGSAQTALTGNPASDSQPAWSPDGSKLAFTSDRDGTYDIYFMNADGSAQASLTSYNGSDFEPAWSPDGSKIAFTSYRDANFWEVFVMNADGSAQTALTGNPASDSQPAWSPDGSKIAFTSSRDGNYEVYVMNADGSGQTNLTNDPASNDSEPAWSPDGSKLAFTSDRDGNTEVYVMNADGSAQTRLTSNPAEDFAPDWQMAPSTLAFAGFFSPVDNPPVLNVLKGGQALAVKFSLGGNQGLNIFAAGYPISQQIACDTSSLLDDVEETVTAGSSSLSYDAATDTYTYVWKTNKAWAQTCRQLTLRLSDGTDHIAYFKFK